MLSEKGETCPGGIPKTKPQGSWIKPDRPKTNKADQVREKRHETLLPEKFLPQIRNMPPHGYYTVNKLETQTRVQLFLELAGFHFSGVHSVSNKLHSLHSNTVWSIFEFFSCLKAKSLW